MLKTTKKLQLNREQLRVLTDTDLDRARGGYVNTAGTSWCSSDGVKCSHGCALTNSRNCANK
jgi:hypothetical protein